MQKKHLIITFLIIIILAACKSATSASGDTRFKNDGPRVLAVESFLVDIAQNIAGERAEIDLLIPPGADPHTFQPTPQDVAKIANSQMLIANGAGLEEWLQEVIDNAGGQRLVVEAAQGLSEKSSRPGDPHFWLDPNYVIQYAAQIRDGFIQIDPDGEQIYTRNAQNYIDQLQGLDTWITDQVEQLPTENRLLITNHESFGYFADRYGFEILGTIIPSVSTGASPSAQQLIALVEAIKGTQTSAIFLESGSNPELAQQLAREAGIDVVVDLRTQPLYPQESYIDMMKYNTQAILETLR
jgi:ABC-type Zn uptake system ZnuABC Zn-binding protein ZnuA